MKHKINFHMHSTGSDGEHSPEAMVQEAINTGVTHLCFTDHYKRAAKDPWAKDFFSEEYITEVKRLIDKYSAKIDLSFGAEIDWYEDYENSIKTEIKNHKFDFILGSAHQLKSSENEYYSINFREKFNKQLAIVGIKNMIKQYYQQIRIMSRSDFFDSVAHLDLIKIFNKDETIFNETDSFYVQEVLDSLDEIKKNGKCIEINTSGFYYDCTNTFPSFWILEEAKKRDIPITIGTDAHWMGRVADGIDKAYEMAKKAGYKSIFIFKDRKPIEVKI